MTQHGARPSTGPCAAAVSRRKYITEQQRAHVKLDEIGSRRSRGKIGADDYRPPSPRLRSSIIVEPEKIRTGREECGLAARLLPLSQSGTRLIVTGCSGSRGNSRRSRRNRAGRSTTLAKFSRISDQIGPRCDLSFVRISQGKTKRNNTRGVRGGFRRFLRITKRVNGRAIHR